MVNDKEYVPKNFNNAPLMVEDNQESIDPNFVNVQSDNIQYNPARGVSKDEGEDTLRQYEFFLTHAGEKIQSNIEQYQEEK